MKHEDYLSYLEKTINTYSKKTKKHLLKIFEKERIVKFEKSNTIQQIKSEEKEDMQDTISCEKNTEDTEALIRGLRNNERAVKIFEKWEFEKDYKYSMIFDCAEFDYMVNQVDKLDELKKCEEEYLFDSIDAPIYYRDKERSFLKFNLNP